MAEPSAAPAARNSVSHFARIERAVGDRLAKVVAMALPPRLMRSKLYFLLWEKRGYHVTPVHFYEPIPDTRTLSADLWSRHSKLVGIDVKEEGQLALLSLLTSKFKEEYDGFPRRRTADQRRYYVSNGWFEAVDGEILYSMIRQFKPARILEIGSGYSTLLSAQAILKNKELDEHYECELVSIEPYPNDTLRAGFAGLSKLVVDQVQHVSLREFESLGENDILFIDSSHVLKIGSDVQYEYLEIIPRLHKGVLIHVHDVFLPAEYPRDWIFTRHWFFTEQYLVQAFLTFNHQFEVMWAGSYMHLTHPDELENAFSSYDRERTWPTSLWIRKTR
jgi:predicted O-methyltransferase YrrM